MGLLGRVASDFAYLTGLLRTVSKVTRVAKNPGRTWPQVVRGLADSFGDKTALISDRGNLSYRGYDRRGDQWARWAGANGVAKGDVVALMMPNCAEYLACWLGVTRAGGIVALLNTNLTGPALAHCVNIVAPKHVIVDAVCLDAFGTAESHLTGTSTLWCYGADAAGKARLDTAVDALSGERIPDAELPALTTDDKCLFVYTSGTTGLPKAANINHYRVQSIMYGFNGVMNVRPSDRVYVCLPMYHTSGGVIAPGCALTAGGSVLIRERFSATMFWDDVVGQGCTIFIYIGELCRYLLNSPTHPLETKHKLRVACGNGLRPDIWADFTRRFRIPRILEWYAATEGNCVFFNLDGKVGAVGRIPKWIESKFSVDIVKLDYETEQPLRGADGFVLRCAPDETGEAISKIVNDPKKPSQRFEGYSTQADTDRKILRDVFEKGDAWFRTGDLMKRDALGYYYFVDRIGDTFRWKGENVATSEVQEQITAFPGVKEANVYGVRIPGAEGRAGMAALVIDDDFDFDGFHRHVTAQLPAYSRPVFLKVMRAFDTTSTFKLRKVDLVKQGFDPAATPDAIYLLHPAKRTYAPLTPELHADIGAGRLRL